MWIRNDDNCGIELVGLKIVDIITGDGYAGCRCSTTNDRNRYDKESKTIICCNYSNCLKDVLKRLPDYKLVEIKECLKAYAGIS